jgi:1-acyl-sn-glycerol-3-phosphate acyltransferase
MKRAFTLAIFLFQIIFFGFFLVYLLCVPLYLMGYFWRPAHRAGAFFFQLVVRYTVIWPLFRCQMNISLPPGGKLTISNHRSTLDTYLLLSHCPGIRVVAKQTLFYIPFLGWMMKLMGHIPLKSGDPVSYRTAFEKAGKILKEGGHVHVFPEMTRCPEGYEGTQEFHLSPFKMARDANVSLIPLAIAGTDHAWPKGEWGMDNRVEPKVKSLEPLEPQDYATADDLRRTTREKINRALEVLHDH